jgi:hypothetical protein
MSNTHTLMILLVLTALSVGLVACKDDAPPAEVVPDPIVTNTPGAETLDALAQTFLDGLKTGDFDAVESCFMMESDLPELRNAFIAHGMDDARADAEIEEMQELIPQYPMMFEEFLNEIRARNVDLTDATIVASDVRMGKVIGDMQMGDITFFVADGTYAHTFYLDDCAQMSRGWVLSEPKFLGTAEQTPTDAP